MEETEGVGGKTKMFIGVPQIEALKAQAKAEGKTKMFIGVPPSSF